MQNNEILERLLQDDKQAKPAVKDQTPTAKSRNNEEIQISRIRVVTAKYKVYIVLLLIFIFLLLLNYIPSEKDSLKSNQSSFQQVNSKLDSLKKDIKIAENDMDFLCNKDTWILSKEEVLVKCLNERRNCSEIPDTWKTWTGKDISYNLDIPLSYLQVNSLYNKKMPVDEKRVLRNLNEYLIKQNISWTDRKRVWEILKIEIGDPKAVKWWNNHFFEVPVKVEIEFPTVGDLTGFLYNIEKKLIENREDRILYKIQSVSYDIVTNDEPQVTDISMIAYYYYDEKFGDEKECDGEINSDKTKNDNIEEVDSSSDSDSFIQNILKNFKK